MNETEQEIITGSIPLSEVQFVFLDQEWSDYEYPDYMAQKYPAADHFITWQYLAVLEDLSQEMLAEAIDALLLYHDGLRLRLAKVDGRWTLSIVPPGEATPLVWKDISHASPEEQVEIMRSTLWHEFRSLSLNQGPIMKCVYFKPGGGEPGRLCVILSHILGDGMSAYILADDLQTVLMQLSRGQKIALPPKSTSVKAWAERVEEYARSGKWEKDLERLIAYKRSWSPPNLKMLPLDYPEGKLDEKPIAVHFAPLGAHETGVLMKKAARVWKVRMLDVIQAAMVKTLAPWLGVSSLPMCVIVHGRDQVFEDVDVSRTVGSFAMGVLEVLDYHEDIKPVLSPLADPRLIFAQMLLNFSRALERSYESDGGEKYISLYDRYNPQVAINFQRYADQTNEQRKLFQILPKSELHEIQDLAASRSLGCFSWIERGQLCMNWEYSPYYFKPSTIEQLAENFLKELTLLAGSE